MDGYRIAICECADCRQIIGWQDTTVRISIFQANQSRPRTVNIIRVLADRLFELREIHQTVLHRQTAQLSTGKDRSGTGLVNDDM